ncbi:MAG: Na+/H+ antiporter NhaA [Alphaproteobacteria bacterium]
MNAIQKKFSISPEKLSGLLLIFATLLALTFNNSPLAALYDSLLTTPFIIKVGEFGLDKPLLLWINDGLMAIFFFLVGLEIKREVLTGQLNSLKKASLPIVAALGGVIFPALIYISLNYEYDYALKGWAIPMATDIAFALGILALIGKNIPKELKILLLSLAIIDDLIAIIVIALFYTENLSFNALMFSSLGILTAITLNIFRVKKISPYIVIGIFIWVCVLKSGVHATLAGVILAMCIPMTGHKNEPLVENIEHTLHPWVYFMIMPIFAFANAGLNLQGFDPNILGGTIPLGIILGLFLGKQMGVFSFVWISCKAGLCKKPEHVTWTQIYGLAILTGIGFTMSLFIGTLAYEHEVVTAQVRLGVLVASILSAVAGYSVLKLTTKNG